MVRSIVKALKLLEVLSNGRAGVGVTDLAKSVGMPVSTVHRLLLTLRDSGYVVQDKNERYRLGWKIMAMSRQAGPTGVRELARPVLDDLRDTTGETAHLAVFDGGQSLIVESAESLNNYRSCSPTGYRAPMYCTAVGKALLAFLPQQHCEALFRKKVKRFTPATITLKSLMKKELETIRRTKLAFDNEEGEKGVRCIAAPIFDGSGAVVAAVGISGPAERVTADHRGRFARLVQEAAAKIGEGIALAR
jgi:IclR family transcriptional regulator, KDG regulon repressor